MFLCGNMRASTPDFLNRNPCGAAIFFWLILLNSNKPIEDQPRWGNAVQSARIWCLVLITALFAAPTNAGPWPREPKAVFLSFAVERDRDGDSYTGLYGEYGLTPRLTLGIELGRASEGQGETSAIIWVQRALDNGEGPNRYAIASGIGAIRRDGEIAPVGLIAANWGRGIEWLPGGGWITVEGRVKFADRLEKLRTHTQGTVVDTAYLTSERTFKTDVTLGMRPMKSLMFINQIRFEDRKDSDFSTRLASSLVHDLPGPAKVELGVVTPISGPGETALKIGTWIEF